MKNIKRTDLYREFSLWLIFMLAGIVALLLLPAQDAAQAVMHYLPLHTSMEMVSIAISAMIIGVAWVTQKYQPDGRVLAFGMGFLGVALLDWSHALSSAGMPDYITENGTEKSINFWLMARLFAGLTFILVAFWPTRLANKLGYVSRYWVLTLIVLLVGVVHFLLLFYQADLPRTFIQGEGLTDFKIYAEYFLIVLYVAAGAGFLRHAKFDTQSSYVLLALASFTMAMSEFFFTLYANVNDAYNVAGHVYKILAYGFLYRGIFLVTVRRPYDSLKASESQYAATLNTLPDLLFEVDRQGVYRSVHASKLEQLAVPSDGIIGKRVDEMLPPEAARTCFEAIYEADRLGSSHGYRIKLDVPEGLLHFELSISKRKNENADDDTFLVLSRDITATAVSEEKILFEAKLNSMLLALQAHAESEKKAEFLRRSVTLIQTLMESPVVAIYTVHDDQSALDLLIWSDNSATQHYAFSSDTHTPVTETGSWADALREQRLFISEHTLTALDTLGLPTLPQPLYRLMSVPALEDDLVKLVVLVGNKSVRYTENEANALKLLTATLWSMLKQRNKNMLINQLSEALEQSPHSVVITDTQANIQYVNRTFSEVSGYSAQEVLGKNPRILQSGETSPSLYRELWKCLNSGQSWQGEFINRKKDGQIFEELVAVYPIQDRFGELTHYVAHKIDVTESKAAKRRLRDLSDFDALTGLLNKKSFYTKLTEAINEADRGHELLSLLWFNLDNFKVINESFGHDAGDELLVTMAGRLLDSVGSRATVARHSGDTFVVIIPEENQSFVALIAADILNRLKSPLHVASQEVSVGASAGIAVFPEDAKTAGKLASAAEIAMYRAKDEGRNSLRFFATEMQQNTQRSLDLAVSLAGAQERGELYLVYQPQYSVVGHRVIGAEALLRWQHPKWGPVSPSEFIPIAEQTGLIVPIGRWVLEHVARQIKEWELAGLPELLVAVNVSAVQFVRPGFAAELIHVMSHTSVSTRLIEIEITEAVALKNSEQAVAIIEQLHSAGFRIALDDFGTGYSSLSYLRRYAIDKLKIDQSFVNELTSNDSDQSIVTAIIKMAHGLGMSCIAEGVETAEQAGFLKDLGCDELQGYWLSRPVSATELTQIRLTRRSDQPIFTG